MNLKENFNQQEFIDWISNFLPEFSKDIRKVDILKSFQGIKSIQTIGESSLGVRVYIIETDQDQSKRKVGLAKESFTLLRNYGTPNAIIVYFSENSSIWRLSLLTSALSWDAGKINKKLSNPKRQSYVLGLNAKVKTPFQYLISKGNIIDFDDLKSRFSLEVVNKEFYQEISQSFVQLVEGSIEKGRSKKNYETQLKLPNVKDKSQTSKEFAVRLIGRVIFCWFLREKRSTSGHSLMPKGLLSFEASSTYEDYYHKILEPIFFEVLNKQIKSRKEVFVNELFSAIPYLNGGLFSPHEDDFFNYNEVKQTANHKLVVVPDKWLRSLFEVLETYNFTIDENTSFDEELSIDPEMLGRIFENLLAEINPETGESARKSTGSYYTPRVIVNYMVDESLYLYLKEKTNISEVKLRSLISYDLDDDISNPLCDEEKEKIAQSLGKIKILDPACGSGAFPIGALQKIVFILQQIDQQGKLWFKRQIEKTPSLMLRRVIEREFKENNFDYIRKLGIIQDNIFGIDIQPIATEISRLRCFLTLVVDERIDDTLDNRGIEPLPNLDFKFVTANTLIGLPKVNAQQPELFDDHAKVEKLKELIEQYFTARDEERKDVMISFSELQSEMINELIDKHSFTGVAKADLTRKLTEWKPFKHKSTDWFDPEWMFGIKDGFDVVIANPPYVGEKGHKSVFETLRKTSLGQRFSRGKMDLFYYFFHLGIDALKEKGLLVFITTNYYPTADGALKLRKDFYNRTNIVELINFNEYKIFESALGQHNMITLIQKTEPDEMHITNQTFVTKHGGPNESELSNILNRLSENGIYTRSSRSDLFDGDNAYIRFTMGKNETASILTKIANIGSPLKEYATTNEGLHTGLDSISDKDLKKTDNKKIIKGEGVYVLTKGQFSFKHLCPWFKGSDIRHYVANTNNKLEVLYYENGILPEDNELEHLVRYKNILENRVAIKRANRPWYQLSWPRKRSMFIGPKIVNPYRSHNNYFALVDIPWFASADVFFTETKDSSLITNKVLTAILNSKVVLFWLKNRGKRKGDILELKSVPIGQIPIVIPNTYQITILTKYIAEIIKIKSESIYADTSQYELKIDLVVYELYKLKPDEISIIESQTRE